MPSMDTLNDQNVVLRVANLPLVSSTYDIMSKVYEQTKDQHPYIKTVCDAAELGVKTVTSVAICSALPIMGKLEPQISLANGLACAGLDKIEKKLPILLQPSEQVVANAKGVVIGAKEVVSMTMSGAKETVSSAVTGVLDRTRGAVQGGVEMTCAAVSGGVSTVTDSRVAQMVSDGVGTALSTSERLVDQYLPPGSRQDTMKGCRTLDGGGDGDDDDVGSYYARLGSLSSKVRHRAYQRAVARVMEARKQSQESIQQLQHTMDLLEKNIGSANQKIQEKLSSAMEWGKNGDTPPNQDAVHIESRTLALAHCVSRQLHSSCQNLVSCLQGAPQHIQNQLLSVTLLANQVYCSLSQAVASGSLSDGVLATSRSRLSDLREALDHTMDYLVNNTPLNWLVGPFYPHVAPPTGQSTKPHCPGRRGGGRCDEGGDNNIKDGCHENGAQQRQSTNMEASSCAHDVPSLTTTTPPQS